VSGAAGQLQNLSGERIGKKNDHGDKRSTSIARDSIIARPISMMVMDFALAPGLRATPSTGAFHRQTLTETGPEGPDRHAETGSDHTPREKLHCPAPFIAAALVY